MKRLPMVVVSVAVALTACGGTTANTSSSGAGGPSKVASIAAEIPDATRAQAPFQIATDDQFDSVLVKRKDKPNVFPFKAERPGQYFWRVRGHAKESHSGWSQTRKLEVK